MYVSLDSPGELRNDENEGQECEEEEKACDLDVVRETSEGAGLGWGDGRVVGHIGIYERDGRKFGEDVREKRREAEGIKIRIGIMMRIQVWVLKMDGLKICRR